MPSFIRYHVDEVDKDKLNSEILEALDTGDEQLRELVWNSKCVVNSASFGKAIEQYASYFKEEIIDFPGIYSHEQHLRVGDRIHPYLFFKNDSAMRPIGACEFRKWDSAYRKSFRC